MADEGLRPARDERTITLSQGRQERTTVSLARFLAVAFLVWVPGPALLAQSALGPVDGQALSPYDLERVTAGDTAPDFRLQDHDGQVHQLSQYRGRNVVLVLYRGFW